MVHGVHGLLWALDCIARDLPAPHSLARIEAKFLHAIVPGEGLECRFTSDAATFTGSILRGGMEVTRVAGTWADRIEDAAVVAPEVPGACRDHTFADAAAASGQTPASVEPSRAATMFSALAARLPARQFAVLLATTRIVGMECPGLHSMFSSLRLAFPGGGDPVVRWRASRANERFSSIEVTIDGAGVEGVLATFFRPPPKAQPTMAELAACVVPGEFAAHRALVVGGSRGLGEVASKLLAAGGAQVCISYASGVDEATRVCAETAAASVRWDVTADDAPALPWAPTLVCFFATPHIAVDKAVAFSSVKFERFAQFYVVGFHRVVQQALGAGDAPLAVLYPSTVFLETGEPNMAEYCAAKAAGEELCRQLVRRFPRLRIAAPRLPRVQTDQTSGLLPVPAQPPVDVLLPVLRELAGGPR